MKSAAGIPSENRVEEINSTPRELRALCRLAAGLSHEMNNLLAVVNRNAGESDTLRDLPDAWMYLSKPCLHPAMLSSMRELLDQKPV